MIYAPGADFALGALIVQKVEKYRVVVVFLSFLMSIG